MITFFEFKTGTKINKDDFSKIKESIKKNGFVIISLKTDDNKTQVKQFEAIKKSINYKPDKNLKIYWNNSNNFVIADVEKNEPLSF
jgi:hypothetical protein